MCCQYSNHCEWYSDHCKVLPVVITVNVASTLIINFVKIYQYRNVLYKNLLKSQETPRYHITQSTSLHTTDEI